MQSINTPLSTTASMEVAHSILGMFTCGFHGTYGWQNVFDSGRGETWLPDCPDVGSSFI